MPEEIPNPWVTVKQTDNYVYLQNKKTGSRMVKLITIKNPNDQRDKNWLNGGDWSNTTTVGEKINP